MMSSSRVTLRFDGGKSGQRVGPSPGHVKRLDPGHLESAKWTPTRSQPPARRDKKVRNAKRLAALRTAWSQPQRPNRATLSGELGSKDTSSRRLFVGKITSSV